MEYEMKPQPGPALTVKPSEHVAAPGRERPLLLSLYPYYISAGLPAPAWAQKPRRWVTHDKCPRVWPTGPAWPCHSICSTGPRRALACQFQVKSSPKRKVYKKVTGVPVSPELCGHHALPFPLPLPCTSWEEASLLQEGRSPRPC